MPDFQPISIHRLPPLYRWLLVCAWAALPTLLFAAILLGGGLSTFSQSPMLAGLLLVMLFPAYYVWQQGVDVCGTGLRIRVHVPRYYPYSGLGDWNLEETPYGTILFIRNSHGANVFAYHCAHLTHLEHLLSSLNSRIEHSGPASFVKNAVLPHD